MQVAPIKPSSLHCPDDNSFVQRNGAPACAVSFADDGLAGKHMAGLPGISTPFAILSWPFTSALLHCEDAGLGAYNLLLSGAAKVITNSMSEMY